jgi:hypothetical protein
LLEFNPRKRKGLGFAAIEIKQKDGEGDTKPSPDNEPWGGGF